MNKNLRSIIPVGLYFVTILSLFLYSFTQIDLSLTFSRIEILRNITTSFQYIGYFNRPLSAYIYVGLLVLLFGFYLYFIKQALSKKHQLKFFWKIILATSAILVLSYNAFSYDLFNYIFDAKIFTYYGLNPYLHKALDFPADPMLSFMRWTHRVYPYGPVWLGITIPLSYLGQNFFLPTFFLFKIFIAGSYLGSIYLLGKILRKINPAAEPYGVVFFALNPLVIIESLVSGHLDMVMIFFALFAFYNLINKKYIFSFVLLLFSIGIKFGTVFLLPVFILVAYLQYKNKKINWQIVAGLLLILMLVTVCVSANYSGNFQPWYLLLPLAFAALLSHRYFVLIPSVILSFAALTTYVPYLYLGNWDPPVPTILLSLQIGAVSVSLVVTLFYYLINQKLKIKYQKYI
jgi:hypothetical protein